MSTEYKIPMHVGLNQLRDEYGISYSSQALIKLEKNGTFPERSYLSHRKPIWLRTAVEEWLSGRTGVSVWELRRNWEIWRDIEKRLRANPTPWRKPGAEP